MSKPSITQSQKRFHESIASLFSETPTPTKKSCLFLKSSSDVGVIRNGGRNGARFAPQSLLATFKKFSQNQTLKNYCLMEFEVASIHEEMSDFKLAQTLEAQRIRDITSAHPHSMICQLGGGHDHVYPLLMAKSGDYSRTIVINVDAHADTRTDENFHSGTPFRQFYTDYKGELYLFQIGLHPFANSFSTLESLKNGQSQLLWKQNFNSSSLKLCFDEIRSLVHENTLVVFSLDADALSGSEVPGVSAVNPMGFSLREVLEIWSLYSELKFTHSPILGIYELNPLYDSLASISMRTIGSFLFECFLDKKKPVT